MPHSSLELIFQVRNSDYIWPIFSHAKFIYLICILFGIPILITYGAPESTYVKAIDDFSQITAKGGSQVNGPQYFEVVTKAGETYYYGNPGLGGWIATTKSQLETAALN